MTKQISNFEVINEKISNIQVDIKEMKDDIKSIKEGTEFVHREEFLPVRNIVYGLVSLILVGVVGALIALVLK